MRNKEINNLELSLELGNGIYRMESEVRQQKFAVLTQIIRNIGIKDEAGSIFIPITNSDYRGACFHHSDNTMVGVNRIVLKNNENYEVFLEKWHDGKCESSYDIEGEEVNEYSTLVTDMFKESDSEERWYKGDSMTDCVFDFINEYIKFNIDQLAAGNKEKVLI